MAPINAKLISRYSITAAVASSVPSPPATNATIRAPSTTPMPPGIRGMLDAAMPAT
jgi:hypothetical protein